jgi:hypothetical protein
VEAYCLLGLARLASLTVPLRWIVPFFGKIHGTTPDKVPEDEMRAARDISQAVENAARHTPWESRCLVQAIAANAMLRRRGMRGTLYLGLAKDERVGVCAHAWLRFGDMILTGESEVDEFSMAGSFADMRASGR